MNYYLSGIPQDADADTIRRAFRVLAQQYPPDAARGRRPRGFETF